MRALVTGANRGLGLALCEALTARGDETTIVSLSSLVASLQNALHGEYAETRDLWVRELNRGIEARKNPAVAEALIDVTYREQVEDKAGAVEKIYDCFGIEFTGEHRRGIEQLEEEQPTRHFAKHRYSAEDFGVDPQSVREELSHYYDEFGELCN